MLSGYRLARNRICNHLRNKGWNNAYTFHTRTSRRTHMHARVNANVSLCIPLRVSLCFPRVSFSVVPRHGGRIAEPTGSSSVRAAALIGRVHPPPACPPNDPLTQHESWSTRVGMGGGNGTPSRWWFRYPNDTRVTFKLDSLRYDANRNRSKLIYRDFDKFLIA